MGFIKKNIKIIIGFIVGVILASGITYAAVSAREVTYTTDKNTEIKSVADALNDLYNIKKGIGNNSIIEELKRFNGSDEGSRNEIQIKNVNDYKCYYITYIYLNVGNWAGNDVPKDFQNITSTNSTLLYLGEVHTSYSNTGASQKGYIIFPDGSGNDITLSSTITEGVTIYGIK